MRAPRCRYCFSEAPGGDARNQWISVHESWTHKLHWLIKSHLAPYPPGHGNALQTTHFRGQLADGQKFVFCPVGYITSWSSGDYDNQWCHWCGRYFSELTRKEN